MRTEWRRAEATCGGQVRSVSKQCVDDAEESIIRSFSSFFVLVLECAGHVDAVMIYCCNGCRCNFTTKRYQEVVYRCFRFTRSMCATRQGTTRSQLCRRPQ